MRSSVIRTVAAAGGAAALAVSLATPAAAAAAAGRGEGPVVSPPGMAVMHQQHMRNDVVMTQMARLMSEGNPGMARMHELMSGRHSSGNSSEPRP